jgi:hypothetical protein
MVTPRLLSYLQGSYFDPRRETSNILAEILRDFR